MHKNLWVHIKPVQIEYDPAKDDANLARHGVSLRDAEQLDWDAALERDHLSLKHIRCS